MLKIQSLLNPQVFPENNDIGPTANSGAVSPPLTPALTLATSDSSFSPRMGTSHVASPAKRPKLVKDAPVFVKGEARGQVHYPPYDSNEDASCISPHMGNELAQQHKRFKIYPSGSQKDGLISEFVRRIPYSSEKKAYFGKIGWEGFDVFQYTFVVPDDATKKEHTVMWDYNTGLVRITPFFKACKYSKTTPAKALNANPGLKEMSHSVTGGALVAQGYWMPYACARAICLTFAYPIRWALTPIFGPTFVRECLRPDQPGFGRFKVDAETIQCARMAMEGLRSGREGQGQGEIPRSVPEQHLQYQYQQGVQAARPKFKQGSPFDSESDASTSSRTYKLAIPSALHLPAISPKTTTFDTSGWTSINNQPQRPASITVRSVPPSPPPNTSFASRHHSLLTERPSTSYRPDPTPLATPTASVKTRGSAKRAHRPSIAGNYSDNDGNSAFAYSSTSSTSASGSEDEMDVDEHSGPTLRPATKNTHGSPHTAASRSAGLVKVRAREKGNRPGKKYTVRDFRAARLLLELSQAD